MERQIIYPKDAIVIVQDLTTKTGGATLDVAGNVNEVIEAGTIVVLDGSDHKALSSMKCYEAALTGASSVKAYKGHGIKVGDAVKGVTVTAIDTSNSDYDTISGSGTFGAAINLDEAVVNDGDTAVGVVMTTKVVKEDSTVDVGVLVRGEVNEAVMTAPIDAAVKTALPLIHFVTD